MKKKITMFILTMPHVGSWNGQWTGQEKLYCKALHTVSLHDGVYFYRWDDGWEAQISVVNITLAESRKMMKASNGFMGYDWMIDSIVAHGCIKKSH